MRSATRTSTVYWALTWHWAKCFSAMTSSSLSSVLTPSLPPTWRDQDLERLNLTLPKVPQPVDGRGWDGPCVCQIPEPGSAGIFHWPLLIHSLGLGRLRGVSFLLSLASREHHWEVGGHSFVPSCWVPEARGIPLPQVTALSGCPSAWCPLAPRSETAASAAPSGFLRLHSSLCKGVINHLPWVGRLFPARSLASSPASLWNYAKLQGT